MQARINVRAGYVGAGMNVRAGYVGAGINVRAGYVGAGINVRAGYVGAGFDSNPDAVQASRRNPPLRSLPAPTVPTRPYGSYPPLRFLPAPTVLPSSTHHAHLMGLIHRHPW